MCAVQLPIPVRKYPRVPTYKEESFLGASSLLFWFGLVLVVVWFGLGFGFDLSRQSFSVQP